jgi:uncharacterized protein YjiS (DUF1127 family)
MRLLIRVPNVFLNARRDTMMHRAFIMFVVGSVNSPNTGIFKSKANLSGARLGRLKSRIFEWRRRVHSRGELISLSDAELRDIGLSRSEAEIEATKVFWLP